MARSIVYTTPKNSIQKWIFMLLLAFGLLMAKSNVQAQNVQVNFQLFYDELSPYGNWFQDPQYGYVWQPNVGRDFRPYYTNGYWAMTEYGNMWMSNYNWGWAPFHYGRWTHNPMYGWLWIPGTEWGPAWVNWRQGNGHYGWAPLGPNITVQIALGGGYNAPMDWWTFIPGIQLYSRTFHSYYVPSRNNRYYRDSRWLNHTYYDNRYTYLTGPRVDDYHRMTGRRTTVYNVSSARNVSGPRIENNRIQTYRPTVNNGRQVNYAPRSVQSMQTGGNNVNSRNTGTRGTTAVRQQNTQTQNQNIRQTQQPISRSVSREVNTTAPNRSVREVRTTTERTNVDRSSSNSRTASSRPSVNTSTQNRTIRTQPQSDRRVERSSSNSGSTNRSVGTRGESGGRR